MPTLFTINGYRFFFYSDEHEPIHIHIVKGSGRAKFNVVPTVEHLSSQGLKLQKIKEVKEIVEQKREAIIEAWKEFHK